MGVKSRSWLAGTMSGHYQTWNGQTLVTDTRYTGSSTNTQWTSSTGHAWPPRSRASKRRDIGGAFHTWCNKALAYDGVPVDIITGSYPGGLYRKYTGTIHASSRNLPVGSTPLAPSTTSQLNALGSTGIRRAIPTNPLAGMGQFLGELRDLPSVPDIRRWKRDARRFLDLSRRGSKEYLNVQFGWLPFIKDLRDFYHAAAHAEKHIAQYRRDSGKAIRRRRTILDTSEISTGTTTSNMVGDPALPTPMFSRLGRKFTTTTTTRKVWFSGSFTYYLPEPKNFVSRAKEIEMLGAKLFGLRVTPSLIWQLAPWSWAIDWRTNIGDVIHNWSAFQNDGLVMRYGYVMETKSSTTVYTLMGTQFAENKGTCDGMQAIEKTVKSRLRATPYGFGLNPSSFSARQWSIIAALGISRMPRAL